MCDREAEVRDLAESIAAHEAVEDAWIAKTFNDLMLVLELPPGDPVPEGVRRWIDAHGLEGSNQVYGVDEPNGSFAGCVGETDRYQFVDTQTRGEYTSFTAPGEA